MRRLTADQKAFLDIEAGKFCMTMKCHADVLKKLIKGHLMYTEEPMGGLYDLTTDMFKTVEELEKSGNYRVIHVIKGKYAFGDGSKMRFETYILQSLMAASFGQIVLDYVKYNARYCANVYSFVKNVDAEMFSEHGNCLVAGNRAGSISRVV